MVTGDDRFGPMPAGLVGGSLQPDLLAWTEPHKTE
jgi:hypothetical protein